MIPRLSRSLGRMISSNAHPSRRGGPLLLKGKTRHRRLSECRLSGIRAIGFAAWRRREGSSPLAATACRRWPFVRRGQRNDRIIHLRSKGGQSRGFVEWQWMQHHHQHYRVPGRYPPLDCRPLSIQGCRSGITAGTGRFWLRCGSMRVSSGHRDTRP